MIYYNENDEKAAAWLRELMVAGEIPYGVIDTRSIEDVIPTELAGFTQCHFFAGIGGWPLALRYAGWPDTRPVWTGSCPCQPFSAAGKGDGVDDPRHLYPAWGWLIDECRPPIVFGEQVASKAGRAWLGSVQTHLEALGYAVGRADVCAAGVGAPHWRQREWFVGIHYTTSARQSPEEQGSENQTWDETRLRGSERGRDVDQLAHTTSRNTSAEREQRSGQHGLQSQDGRVEWLADSERDRLDGHGQEGRGRQSANGGNTKRLADSIEPGLERQSGHGDRGDQSGRIETQETGSIAEGSGISWSDTLHGFWRDADWLYCTDGKWRPVEPGTFPLAHGIPGRVGLLRGYGNAIVPQVAQAFIEAVMDT